MSHFDDRNPPQRIDALKFEPMDRWVSFGDVSRGILLEQCQYGSWYVNSEERHRHGKPYLADGLRVYRPRPGDYHDYLIHLEDVPEFVERFIRFQKSCGALNETAVGQVRNRLDIFDRQIVAGSIEVHPAPSS